LQQLSRIQLRRESNLCRFRSRQALNLVNETVVPAGLTNVAAISAGNGSVTLTVRRRPRNFLGFLGSNWVTLPPATTESGSFYLLRAASRIFCRLIVSQPGFVSMNGSTRQYSLSLGTSSTAWETAL
jgi:hypothetical protein